MRNYKEAIEIIANDLLSQNTSDKDNKPNYTNRQFMNTIIIFQTALMDKMYDLMEQESMEQEDRLNMAKCCGEDFRKLVKIYTGLDTHEVEKFL